MNARKTRPSQYSDPVATAVEQIDDLIGRGRLVAGQRLVESDLVEQLGIGRVPVREALRILAGDGVIELMPNRGARVRAYSGRHIAEMLKTLTALLGAGIEEFVESPDYAAGMAELVRLDRQISASIKRLDLHGLFQASGQYQQTIFDASGNEYLVELHRRVHFHHYNRQIVDAVGFAELSRLAAAYAGMTPALAARDAPKACALLRSALPPVIELLRRSDAPAAAPAPATRRLKAGGA